jgi:hypothetical protein
MLFEFHGVNIDDKRLSMEEFKKLRTEGGFLGKLEPLY